MCPFVASPYSFSRVLCVILLQVRPLQIQQIPLPSCLLILIPLSSIDIADTFLSFHSIFDRGPRRSTRLALEKIKKNRVSNCLFYSRSLLPWPTPSWPYMGLCRIACLVCLPSRIFFLTLHYISHLSSSSSFLLLPPFTPRLCDSLPLQEHKHGSSYPFPVPFTPSHLLVSSGIHPLFLLPSLFLPASFSRHTISPQPQSNRFDLDTLVSQQHPQQPPTTPLRKTAPSLCNLLSLFLFRPLHSSNTFLTLIVSRWTTATFKDQIHPCT